MNASTIVTGVFQLLGRPSLQDMPYTDILTHTSDVVTGRLLDMSMAGKNRQTLMSEWVQGTDQTMDVGDWDLETDRFIPTKVEARTAGSEGRASTVQVVALEQLEDLALKANGEMYCAFHEDFQSITFSDLESVVDTKEYRIHYEPISRLDLVVRADTQIDDVFTSLCKYETALRCLDQVENDTEAWTAKRERLRPGFLAIFLQEQARFDKFNKTRFGNKKFKRQGFRV